MNICRQEIQGNDYKMKVMDTPQWKRYVLQLEREVDFQVQPQLLVSTPLPRASLLHRPRTYILDTGTGS